MKTFNRVLAMLLAIIMTLAVLPLGVFADAWLDTKEDSIDNDSFTTTTTVTVTLDPDALLKYLKSGDKTAIIEGISWEALKDVFTRAELGTIFPQAKLQEIVSELIADLDTEFLMKYLDVEKLLEKIDTDALIEKIKNLPNLEDYILDYDAFMEYIGEDDLTSAVAYIDTERLIDDYTDELIPLALELDAETLASVVDIDAVMELEGINLSDTIDMDYVKNTIGIDVMFDDYINEDAFADYLHDNFTDVDHLLHDYIIHEQLDLLLAEHEEEIEPYMNFDKLQNLVEGMSYSQLKPYLHVEKLYDTITATPYAELQAYIDADVATDILSNPIDPEDPDSYVIEPEILALYMDGEGKVDVEALKDSEHMTDAVYDALIDGNAVDMTGMLTDEDTPLDMNKLHDDGVVDVKKMVTGEDRLFTIDQIEDAEVIDLDKVLLGDDTIDPLDKNLLIHDYEIFDLQAMLEGDDPLFEIPELIAADGVVDVDKLVEDHTYDNLVDVNALKDQINALPDKNVLADCINDPAGAIKAVGVSKAVEETCGSYEVLINKYVTDKAALMTALGLADLISEIADDEKLDVIFDVDAIVDALGVSELIKLIEPADLKTILDELRANGGLKEIMKSIEPQKYISALTSVLSVLEKNINQIKIEDTVITKKDGNLLFIDTSSLLVLLEDIFPRTEDIAKIGEDGKVLSADFSIEYKSDTTLPRKKNVKVNVVLASRVDEVRKAAQKLAAGLDKFVTYDFKDGIFSMDLRIPSKFATAMKKALQKLETTGDPDLQDLKDQMLEIFDSNASDMGALVEGFKLDQIVSLLELVDAGKFSEAYGKLMTKSYVDTLLNYIKEKTGQDFTDLTPADLAIKATELPTLETLCEKIEEKLGKNIDAFDKLPDGNPAEILDKIAAKAGIDVDTKKILKDAAKQDDPLKYLYETFVSIIENNEDAYEAAKSRVINLYEKALASSYAQNLKHLSLSDFYEGNSAFHVDVKIDVAPVALMKRAVDKLINFVVSKKDIDKDLLEQVADIFIGYFTDDTLVLGLDATIRTEGMYKASFYDENGNEILTTLLPAGADLKLMQDYTPIDPEKVFIGWKALTTDEHYEKMPASDIGLIADVGKLLITVVNPEDATELVGVIEVAHGDALNDYLSELNALVRSWTENATLEDEEIIWLDYASKTECDMEALIETNLYLTWRLEVCHDVTIVDPESGETVLEYLNIPDGATLEDKLAEMIAKVEEVTGKDLDEDEIIWVNTADDQPFAIGTPVKSDLTLTWTLKEKVTVTIVDPTTHEQLLQYPLYKGDKLSEAQINEMIEKVKEIEDDITLSAEEIVWHTLAGDVFDVVNDTVEADLTLTWSLDLPETPLVYVTLVDKVGETITTYIVNKGETLSPTQIADMIEKVKAAEDKDDLNAEDIHWVVFATNAAFDPATAVIDADIKITWKLDTPETPLVNVTLVDKSGNTLETYIVNKGEKLNATQIADMIEKVKAAEDNDELTAEHIIWQTLTGEPFDVVNTAIEEDISLTWELDLPEEYTITIVDPDNTEHKVGSVDAIEGNTLADLLDEMNEIVRTYLGISFEDEDISWFYLDGSACDMTAVITSDLTVYWDIYVPVIENVTVTLVDKLGGTLETYPVVKGEKLNATQIADMIAKVKVAEENDELTAEDIHWVIAATSAAFDPANTILNEDVTITWKLDTPDTPLVIVTLVDKLGEILETYIVNKGEKLSATQIADMIAKVKDAEDNDELTAEDIHWVIAGTSAAFDPANTILNEDVTITWKLDTPETPLVTVTLVDKLGETLETYIVNKGEKLSATQIADMIAKVKDAEDDDTLTAADIKWVIVETSAAFDPANTILNEDVTITWKLDTPETPLVTVTLVDKLGETLETYIVNKGEKLNATQIADMIEKVKDAEDDDTLTAADIHWVIAETSAAFDPADTILNEDVTITWKLDTPETPLVTVTLVDKLGETLETYIVNKGEKLSATQIADMIEKVKDAEDDDTLTAAKIKWVNTATDTEFVPETMAVNEDITLSWTIKKDPVVETYEIKLYEYGTIGVDGIEPKLLWSKDGIAYGTSMETIYAMILSDSTVSARIAELNPSNVMHKYYYVWKKVVGSNIHPISNATVVDDLVLTWDYEEDDDRVAINVVGQNRGDQYHILTDAAGNWVIEWADEEIMWPDVLELNISVEFYRDTEHDLIVRSKNTVHKFVFSKELLHKVESFVATNPALFEEEIKTISIHYENGMNLKPGEEDPFNYADESGAVYFTMGFYFNGYDGEEDHEQSIGLFDGDGEFVEITLPFANGSKDGDKKTFVTFAGKDVDNTLFPLEDVALYAYDAINGSATFFAPHFSYGAIVNKYLVYTHGAPDTSLLPDGCPKPTEQIATFPIVSGYYAQGESFGKDQKYPWEEVKLLASFKGYSIVGTKVYNGNDITGAYDMLGETYMMPGNAITLQHLIDIQEYYIYYYVNNKLVAVDSYTMLEALPELRALPDGYTAEDGWRWDGYEAIDPAVEQIDMYVYLVSDTDFEAEKLFTVLFYDVDGKTLLKSLEKAVSEWANMSEFPTVSAILEKTDVTKAGYWAIKVGDSNKALSELTTAEWDALLAENTELNVYLQYTDRIYTIYTDGNAMVNTITATVGTKIQVTIREEIGKTATVIVHNLSNATAPVAFTFDEGSAWTGWFEMPAADVEIEIVYTASTILYTNALGNVTEGKYGDVITLPAILIPETNTFDAAAVSKDLVLVSSSMDESRNLVLVYQYVLVESVNEAELIASVKVKALNWQLSYVLNGKLFATGDDALKTLSGNATFNKWSEKYGKNLHFASLNLASENLEPSFLILCIVLIVLILILLIVLFYILYITGKLKPNWFLKAITAIVSGFYAVCMAIARAGLALARLCGYREEDLLETSEEINARIGAEEAEVIAPVIWNFDAKEDQAAEEVTEATTEEATEEASEEASEEATEEATEGATEETAEESNEESSEDAATAAAVEEAIAVVVEEANAEAVAEATEEVAEEATEEVAEEATEEVAEEATEEVAEEATEEVAEEATEEVAEEATEEDADKENN